MEKFQEETDLEPVVESFGDSPSNFGTIVAGKSEAGSTNIGRSREKTQTLPQYEQVGNSDSLLAVAAEAYTET